MEAYSWEDVIANVGGLLGLWLGASVVSFVQIIHVCLCGSIDKRLSAIKFRKFKNAVYPRSKSNEKFTPAGSIENIAWYGMICLTVRISILSSDFSCECNFVHRYVIN